MALTLSIICIAYGQQLTTDSSKIEYQQGPNYSSPLCCRCPQFVKGRVSKTVPFASIQDITASAQEHQAEGIISLACGV